MKLDFRNGLLFISLTLGHNGHTKTIDNIILDTGAAQSILDQGAVEDLEMEPEDDDIIVTTVGIGGHDYAVQKRIDVLQFGSYSFENPYIDFGNLEAHSGINGLLGSDILVNGRFIIDLDRMEVYQR